MLHSYFLESCVLCNLEKKNMKLSNGLSLLGTNSMGMGWPLVLTIQLTFLVNKYIFIPEMLPLLSLRD